MSYQVLARKWRPRRFAELVGQEHVVRALVNSLDRDHLHHAYLFTGTRGVGKTTIARIFARSLNCGAGVTSTPCGECSACVEIDEGRFVDLIEVDAASRTRVDETRELLDNVQYAPTRGRFKVYLIDEVHMFSGHSFNALLKTLEEPPPHVKFLLATTDPKKLPVTILSRCLQFNLRRLLPEEIRDQLERIARAEAIEAEPAALRLLAEAADGSVRDALSLLDQAVAYGGGRLLETEVADMLGTVDREQIYTLAGHLAAGDAAALLAQVEHLAAGACDFQAVLGELLGVLQRVAVQQVLGDTAHTEGGEPSREQAHIEALAARMSAEDCQLCYQIGLLGRRDLPLAPDPRAGFEMTLLRMLAFRPDGGTLRAADAPAAGAARPAQPVVAGAPPQAPAPRAKPARSAPSPAADRDPGGDAAAAPPAKPARSTPSPAADRDPGADAAAAPPASAAAWAAFVDGSDLSGLTRELAANCVPDGDTQDELRLLLAPHCKQLRSAARERRIEALVRERCGAQLRVHIEVGAASGAETPVVRRERLDREQEAAAAQAIAEDPNVQAICARFDGHVETTSALGDGCNGNG